MSGAYYNEIDRYAAQWLRNLIAAGHIAPGDVDERSITEVHSDDLRGYTQCHFFAGVGGWSYALRLAGWPDDRPVWTGSCPCQPFSAAGAQRGSDDERHLWPAFFRLIGECRPASVFGEQVAGTAGLAWLDHVCADLEGAGYAAAAADLCAAGVGAPHIRQRLYWVAHGDGHDRGATGDGAWRERADWRAVARRRGDDGSLAHSPEPRRSEQPQRDAGENRRPAQEPRRLRDAGELAHADGGHASTERQQRSRQQRQQPQNGGPGLLGNAGNEGLEIERRFPGVSCGASRAGEGQTVERADPLAAWSAIEWIACADGKARPTQRGIFPLAYGLPGGGVAVGSAVQEADPPLSPKESAHQFSRVGVLRGAGNAIVPQVAAAFIVAAGSA